MLTHIYICIVLPFLHNNITIGIRPGENFTYTFRAWPAGTHYWHSHMDGMQSAKGLRGAFIVHDKNEETYMPPYDEEKIIVLADEWRDPEVCLKLEGAMAGNDVCSDIDYASFNGQVEFVVWRVVIKFQRPHLLNEAAKPLR